MPNQPPSPRWRWRPPRWTGWLRGHRAKLPSRRVGSNGPGPDARAPTPPASSGDLGAQLNVRGTEFTWPDRFVTTTVLASHFEVMTVACAKGPDPSEDAVAAGGARVAVADGASSSWEAGRWSQALVDAWVKASDDDEAWLIAAQRQFSAAMPDSPGELAWLEEAAAQKGAHAAFLGLEVSDEVAHLRWRARSVGDVTAAVVHRDAVVEVFPDPEDHGFGSHPPLVSSLQPTQAVADQHESTLADGEVLLVMTDAVAEYVVTSAEPAALATLAGGTSDAITGLLSRAGRAGDIEVDDLTLLRLRRRVSEEGRTGSWSDRTASAAGSG